MRIEPGSAWSVRIGDLWEFRGIFYFLVWRDLKVRYRQTVFGAVWAVLQPLLLMLVFVLFAGRFLHAPSQGVPYYLFAYAALVPWTLISQALTNSSESLVRDKNLVSKVFFPRVLLPTASAVSFVFDYLVAAALLSRWRPSRTSTQTSAPSSGSPSSASCCSRSRSPWPSGSPPSTSCTGTCATRYRSWRRSGSSRHRSPTPSRLSRSRGVPSTRSTRWSGSLPPSATPRSGSATRLPHTSASRALVTAGLLVSGMLYFRRVDRLFADVI